MYLTWALSMSFIKAETYLKYLEHIDLPRLEIKKIFADGDDVCEFHEVNFDTQSPPLLVCMWFHVDDGKISSIRIVFDPRPFLREQRGATKYARLVKATIYQQTVGSDYRPPYLFQATFLRLCILLTLKFRQVWDKNSITIHSFRAVTIPHS